MTAEQASPAMTGNVAELTIGVLGGTGDQGRGLAHRFAAAGNPVIIGSRSLDRAQTAAAELLAGLDGRDGPDGPDGPTGPDGRQASIRGMANADAATAADLVIVAVPWDGHRDLLAALAGRLTGKIVVDCVNPLGFDKRGAYPLPVDEGSAAQQAATVLPGSRVVGAFHHVSAVVLLDPEVASVDLDVMVLGDDREATDLVQALAARIPGVRGIYAGRLRNCGQVEALTANLVSVNRRYKAHAGLRLTDV